MKVTIFYRNNFKSVGGDGWTYHPLTIEISDLCPVCRCKRGIPYPYRFCEDGEWFTVDKWDNPCTHIDKYCDVYDESKLLEIINQN